MNSDDQFDDLKQFIASRISQAEAHFDQKIEGLEKKMDNGLAGVGEAVEEINKHTDERDKEIEQRLTKLEQQAA